MTTPSSPALVPAGREFSIARTFDAPRGLVFQAWTEPQRLAQWWGPRGFTATIPKLELRPGGTFLYRLKSPDGHEMWGKFVYREIAPPEKLVFVVSFSDKDCGVTRHPLNQNWPLHILSTVTFEEQKGKTTVNVRWVALSPTETERRTFDEGFDSMKQGWTGTLDQLGTYLANPR